MLEITITADISTYQLKFLKKFRDIKVRNWDDSKIEGIYNGLYQGGLVNHDLNIQRLFLN